MGDTKAKFTDTRTGFIDILMCRYEDERLALWIKIVFCFLSKDRRPFLGEAFLLLVDNFATLLNYNFFNFTC